MSEPEAPSAPPPPPPPQDPPPQDPPPPSDPPATGGGSENRTLMIILSYLWILALIPLLVDKDDPEVQWHAKHGLVLTGAELVFWVLVTMLSTFSGFIGCLLAPLYFLGWLVFLGVRVMSMVKGVKGERFLIPGLSQYADRF